MLRLGLGACVAGLAAGSAQALVGDPNDLVSVAQQVPGATEHCTEQVASRVFEDIFECGDELFDTDFNAVDGVGGDIGNNKRFTRVPRYDLLEYVIQPVPRVTGPSAQSCTECHQGAELGGGGDGPGKAALNNIQDRRGVSGGGSPANFLIRNPPHLFGVAAIQLIGEEMSAELAAQRTAGIQQACTQNAPVMVPLSSKGSEFGVLRVTPGTAGATCASTAQVDTAQVQGVDRDLVVRGFGLEGNTAALRSFVLGAFHNELGMEPVEFSGTTDNDRDGVVNEILTPDVSAMTVYLAAQPRPTSEIELDDLRLALVATPEGRATAAELPLPVLSADDRMQIGRGEALFGSVGCARCHTPAMPLVGKTFAEPSMNPAFRQRGDMSPSGINLIAAGVDPAKPLMFDVTMDQPDNRIMVGNTLRRLGSLEAGPNGGAIARVFGDFKRHNLGMQLAESVDRLSENGQAIPNSVFITSELWGLGSSAPYLHDGRASTIEEAILEHGGEATPERDAFRALDADDQSDLLRFLNNLKLFFPEEEEAPAADADADADGD